MLAAYPLAPPMAGLAVTKEAAHDLAMRSLQPNTVTIGVGGHNCDVTIYRAQNYGPWTATGEYHNKPLEAQGETPEEAKEIWAILAWLTDENQPADCGHHP